MSPMMHLGKDAFLIGKDKNINQIMKRIKVKYFSFNKLREQL